MHVRNPRSVHRARRRFARTFFATVLVLAAFLVGLVAANIVQGPRLTSAEVNLPASVTRSGSKLALTLDQPLAAVSSGQVTVVPKADVTSTVSGNTIALAFAGILDYNTAYTVTVTGVTGSFHDASSTVEYSFTTPDAQIYALHRDSRLDGAGVKQPDTVRRTTLRGRGDGDLVFSAPRIEQYVALDDHLAAITLDPDDSTVLHVISLRGGGEPVNVPMPQKGRIAVLHAAPSKHLIAFTFTSDPAEPGRQYQNTPFIFDLTDSSGLPREITGFDGLPLSAMDLTFVPDTTSLVVQAYSQTLFLVDTLGNTPLVPLGLHAEMRGFLPGTHTLIVADPTQGSTIDLSTGSTAALDLAPIAHGDADYPGKVVMVDAHGHYAQLFQRPTDDATSLTSKIAVMGQSGVVVFQPASGSSRIRNFCVSPNGQYLAVETISAEGAIDDYPTVPGFSAMTTVLVNLTTGLSTRSINGFLPSWCG